MTTPTQQILSELADRAAIEECLSRYCRGVDRLDADMVRSAYWPDVVDTHLDFQGNAEEFIEWSFAAMGTMDQTQHFMCNTIINLDGDTADVESYFMGFHVVNGPDGKFDLLAGGRYVDRFEKRDDEWRIAERLVVTDWFRQFEDSADWSNGMLGFNIKPGGRYPDDASYTRIKLV
ncbi:nuclear transport factor 2 family protein [Mangrovimicrobium sediminis]|uniref:Nuclear transport factor 2 family protein n=1 Tax=Mangrovimicrobium sediminis TaxID=2562682 RepID=A0A4Z0LYU8_9GAMM|nr:nuclear transport factor 2 family protein [Haliea sp. SAOS-164]TGD72553.1 nuclear transport factor 2 family protein [Haliea sp. SAOS-164]